MYCFNTRNCFIHKLAHFQTKSKKNDCPGKSSKNPLFSEICGAKTNKLYLSRKFSKKQLFFVNFRGKQFYLNFKLFCPAKLPGQTMPRKCPATHVTG